MTENVRQRLMITGEYDRIKNNNQPTQNRLAYIFLDETYQLIVFNEKA